MTDLRAFTATLLAMYSAMRTYGRELTAETQRVYQLALTDLSDTEFQAAATLLLRTETDFPTPAQFLAAAHPALTSGLDAAKALNATLACTDYDPESGTGWSGRRLRAELGEAVYEAYIVVGRDAGMRQMDSPFHGARLRRDFCDAWTAAVTADPLAALPQPHLALPAPATVQYLLNGIGDIPSLTAMLDPELNPNRVVEPPTPEQLDAKRAAFRQAADAASTARLAKEPEP